MSFDDVSAQQFAERFHHFYQVLAEESPACELSREWVAVSDQEKWHLVAAARLALMEMESASNEQNDSQFFVRPGDAQWGC